MARNVFCLIFVWGLSMFIIMHVYFFFEVELSVVVFVLVFLGGYLKHKAYQIRISWIYLDFVFWI